MLQSLVDLNYRSAMTSGASASAAYASSRNPIFAAAATTVVLTLALAVRLIQGITQPLAEAVLAADRVAVGDPRPH